jgi:hypothetical protein
MIGVGRVEVLRYVSREIDHSCSDIIGTQASYHDDSKEQRTQSKVNHDESPSTYGLVRPADAVQGMT